ncbi:Putative membrane protein [Corynebacterium glyciniphilum AJ 3170]|uniref:Putative membrane protein n=1 Tax=Corynebacterium glyciniphilum AJ 3170 TaxID=1404245 RepID=X5DU46_9CORY|nr:DUF1345 domain-containing protein [Corynebacterium glyciniphilum]AHW64212.1 Putative membrane protein [Corynebacterium glyciniphilum AJ 3170]
MTMPLLRTTKIQVLIAIIIGGLGYLGFSYFVGQAFGLLGGITLGEVVFLVLSTSTLWPMDASQTQANVTREDLAPIADEVLVALVSFLAMVSVVALHLGTAGGQNGYIVEAVMTLVGVFGAWACVHQTYAVHYAYHYYTGKDGGVDFGSEEKPSFVDFIYLSYAVGMTYGVTDSTVTSRDIRKIALRHALISFVFGMVILGAGVNLVTGIVGIS